MDNIEQGSEEWHQLRLGKVTASRVSDVMASGRGSGESKTREKYKNEVIRERLTGKQVQGYINPSMERGTLLEPIARASYEVLHNVIVDQVPFIDHPTIKMAGCSPDGLVGDNGLIEIKIPNPENHIKALLTDNKELITTYFSQVQWQLACSNRSWCDLISFDPDLSEEYQFSISRIYRDDEWIKQAENEVIKFLSEVEIGVLTLKEKLHGVS